MADGNSVFKELEPDDQVPDYLKLALVAEVDTIRNSMQIVSHFTEHLLSAATVCLSIDKNEESI